MSKISTEESSNRKKLQGYFDYLEHYYKQLDDWLDEELKHARDNEERETLKEGIRFKKGELKENVLEASSWQNKLILYNNGDTVYITNSGKRYGTKFSPQTASYRLMRLLALVSPRPINSMELAKFPEFEDEGDRFIRDTIKYIELKLQLHKKDSPFIVDMGYWRLECNVELRVS